MGNEHPWRPPHPVEIPEQGEEEEGIERKAHHPRFRQYPWPNSPQFGEPEPGRAYPDRPAAFGIVVRGGEIALVEVTTPGKPLWRDLPGGGIDPGETPEQAMVREFGEEAGLKVAPGEVFLRADQYFINGDDQSFNVRGVFMTAILLLADAPDGGTTYTAIARHRNPETRKSHEDMGFFDGWGTVTTQLETYAKGLAR